MQRLLRRLFSYFKSLGPYMVTFLNTKETTFRARAMSLLPLYLGAQHGPSHVVGASSIFLKGKVGSNY